HAALRDLRSDPDESVRDHAAWSGSIERVGVSGYVHRHRPILDECGARRRGRADLVGGLTSVPAYITRRTFAGVELDLVMTDLAGKQWYDTGHAWRDLEFIRDMGLIEPGDVVFDVGAHQGAYTLCFSAWTGPSGHVYAFELLRPNCDLIELN